jgi:uracil-DNA glycosylase family 4
MKPGGEACKTCPARDGKLLAPAPLRPGLKLAVVGDAPWRGDFEAGEIGSSERILKKALVRESVDASQIHWTNAVLCACSQKEQKKAAKACAGRLASELEASNATIVLTTGSLATSGSMGRKSAPLAKWRGSVTPSEIAGLQARNALVAPIVNPLIARRSEAWRPIFESDVRRVGRVLRNGFRPPEELNGHVLTIAREVDQLKYELSLLGEEVSGDVETLGLGPTETPLVCLGFSDGKRTVVLPWATSNNGKEPYWLDPNLVSRIISDFLSTRILVTQNGPAFDHIVFERYRIKFDRWDDTLNAAHALRSDMPKNLAFLATLFLDVSAWKQFEDRGADIERLMKYNGRDCLYTILIWKEQKRRLREGQ